MTVRDMLIEDAENMEQIMSRLDSTKDEIWQNRYIYWIAKTLFDLLKEALIRWR